MRATRQIPLMLYTACQLVACCVIQHTLPLLMRSPAPSLLGSKLRETSVPLWPAAPEASNEAPGHLSKKAPLPATAGGSSSRVAVRDVAGQLGGAARQGLSGLGRPRGGA